MMKARSVGTGFQVICYLLSVPLKREFIRFGNDGGRLHQM
jgi:hypothetical protein